MESDDTASAFQKAIAKAMDAAPDQATRNAAMKLLRSGAGAAPAAQITQPDFTPIPTADEGAADAE